jgi:transcriptional regulator with XRE-family HTH domain
MPRAPADANVEKPTRKLREQLGVTQDRLGVLLGMSGADIRNLENGKQKHSAAIFRRILILVGAEYSVKRKKWLVPGSGKLCDWTTLLAWRQSAMPSNMQKRKDYEALSSRVAALLSYSEPDKYNMVFTKISELLDDCLNDYPNSETREVFKKSAPTLSIQRILTTDDYVLDEEKLSVGQELGFPIKAWPNSKVMGVARVYDEFPPAEELLPGNTESGN